MLWYLSVCEKSWICYLSLNWNRFLMSPDEAWYNGHGQTYFGYLTTRHYTVQENCVSFGSICECCLFGSPVPQVRSLWLKLAIHSHRIEVHMLCSWSQMLCNQRNITCLGTSQQSKPLTVAWAFPWRHKPCSWNDLPVTMAVAIK